MDIEFFVQSQINLKYLKEYDFETNKNLKPKYVFYKKWWWENTMEKKSKHIVKITSCTAVQNIKNNNILLFMTKK